jgi:hypothetical protein
MPAGLVANAIVNEPDRPVGHYGLYAQGKDGGGGADRY